MLTLLTFALAVPPPAAALDPAIACPDWKPQVFRGGVADEFAFPADRAVRGPELEAARPDVDWKDFDDAQSNRSFGYTFAELPADLVRARLTFRMFPHSDLPDNDVLTVGIEPDRQPSFRTDLKALPEAGGTWTVNLPTTFVLDLGALPDGTDLIPKLVADRRLDLYLQDDTAVDFVQLEVWACPARVFRAGIRDGFASPTESAAPGADLRARYPDATFRSFDDTTPNRHFGHTFTGLPAGIVEAQLEIRLRPHNDIPTNDHLHLGLVPNASFAFSTEIDELPEAGGDWSNGHPATVFVLDLGALPGGVDLIPKLAADRRLEVYLQDDTAVDDLTLRIWTCPPPGIFDGVPFTGLGTVNPVVHDGDLVLESVPANGLDGLAFELDGAEGFCLGLGGDCPEGYWEGAAIDLAVELGSLTQGSGPEQATLTLEEVGDEVGARTDIDGAKTVRIRNDGVSVAESFHDTPPGELLAFIPPEVCIQEVDWIDLVHPCRGFSVLFTEPAPIRLANGTTATGDRLEIGPACPLGRESAPLRRFAVRAGGVSELRAVGTAVQVFGLLAAPLGGARLLPGPGSLTLTDLGTGGDIGVTFPLGEADSFFVDLAPIAVDSPAPVGSLLRARATGSVGGEPGRSLGELTITKEDEGPMPFAVVPDFSDIGSPSHRVQVLDDHRLVAEIAGHQGTAARVSSWPGRLGKLDGPLECFVGGFPDDVLIEVDGVLHLGDELRVLAEGGGPPIDFKSDFAVEAGGFGELTLTRAAAGRRNGCTPGPTRLCLNDGRFAVEVEWSTARGTGGLGGAVPLTADTGTFWFFDPDNLEMVVKILDGCPVNGRFWIFAAGLTNVETRLTVTDTGTGIAETYLNSQGAAFLPVLDTAAFATCPAGAAAPETAPLGATPAAASTPLVLGGGRFIVEATWRTAGGDTGGATGVTLTDDSGYLWFFRAGNVEAMVKVLDGCPVNDRYWVFAAGLTNVEVDLVVTDTAAGTSRTYHNPQGSDFLPVLDTAAFATCP